MDLWAFDGPEEPETEVAPSRPVRALGIPISRGSGNVTKRPVNDLLKSEESPPAEAEERIQLNVSSKRPKSQPVSHPVYHSKLGGEFDELDVASESTPSRKPAPISMREIAPQEPAVEEIVEETPPVVQIEQDEFSPQLRENAEPVSLRPHLGLSKVEQIGLAALLGVLLLGGGVVYFKTIHRLPTGSESLRENNFPINGEHFTILSAESYWRAPVTEGGNAETFRRGTRLVPVVKLTAKGGPAAVRVLFRNSDGAVIGDAVTRTLQAGTPFEVAATAGFEEVGMHAAYRTGQSKLWKVQIYEAPSVNSPGPAFKKLFEMNISTDRR